MRLQFSLIKGPLRDPVPNVKFTEPGKLLSVVEALALYLFPDTEVRVAVSRSSSGLILSVRPATLITVRC